MKVIAPGDVEIDLGITEVTPTIGIVDYSRRVTDDFGVTTVVPRAFARRMSVRFAIRSADVDEAQQSLAQLRATAARWIASADHAWLDFDGFYKDFSIDVAAGEKSFCTLTVEGLAGNEVVADVGEDPAPAGASTFMLVQPVAITGGALVASNVPETDYAEWSPATIYGLNARVIKAATHRVYESAAANNLANDPAGLAGVWIDIGPTNRWAMFDEALGTVTTRNDGVALTLAPGAVDALALLDVAGATVRVQKGAYDHTKPVVGGAVTFLDLPGAAANIIVTVAGAGAVSVGTLLVGNLVTLGITEDRPSAGITDFSRKEVDDFGEATIVERAWAKRFTANSLISTACVDIVANRVAAVRARPSLWIGADGTNALTVYGFFKDFSIEVGQNVSKLALSIEGLSKAAPPPPAEAPSAPPTDISPTPPLELPEGTLWIAPDGHPYRFGSRPWTSNGALWISNGEPWLGGGYTDEQDQIGVQAAAVAAAVTAQVARIASDNWLTAGEKSGLVLSHKALIENHTALNAKAIALGVAAVERGEATAAVNALNGFLVGLAPPWNDTTQDTPANGATLVALWGAAAQKVALLQAAIQGLPGPEGDPGVDGVDGKGIEFVWKRAAAIPATPVGNGIPAGWSDDPPAGADPLWMSKAKQELDGTLVAGEGWSTPVRHNGADGANGAPGISPVSAVAVPTNKQFTADADGTIKDAGSVLPFNVSIEGQKAGAPIAGTVTIVGVSGCTATAISGGFRFDTIFADSGFAEWKFEAVDGQIVTGKVSFSRQRDPAAGAAVTINFSSTSWWGSGSYAASGPSTVLPASSTGKLRIGGYSTFFCAGNGTATLAGKLQYRAVGSGTWVDSGFSGSASAFRSPDLPGEPGENIPGELSVGGTLTGLTANGAYEIQFVGNRNASGNAIASATGFVSMMQVA